MIGTRPRSRVPALPLAVVLALAALPACDARRGGDAESAAVRTDAQRTSARGACAALRPDPGQPGKDVMWLPTGHDLVRQMLQLAEVGPQDTVVDLGAGDARIPIAAARQFGARARGVEYEADVVDYARCIVSAERLDGLVSIEHGDVFETDFADATVVTMYLLPELNLRLRARLLALRPGTRIVSHRFDMGEWRPDERKITRDGAALLWIVPAHVAGPWRVTRGDGGEVFDLTLQQRYQDVSGTARIGGVMRALRAGRLRGARLEFAFDDGKGGHRRFDGVVNGSRLELREVAMLAADRHFVGTRG